MTTANQYLPGVIQIPSALEITAITNALPMVLSVSADPITQEATYIVGQLVRLNIPYPYGMFQANGLTGQVVAVSSTTISLDIDSRGFDVFVVPTGNVSQPASLSPAGSRNLEFSNLTRQVPFQSLNNIGN